MRPALALALSLAALGAGCTQFPALDARDDTAVRAAPYPGLLPLDGLLEAADAPGAAEAAEAELAARAAALRARAAALRDRPVE